MTIRPRRSVLYMPGSNGRALEKAKTIDADALILDLEDAVTPEQKELARTQVVDAIKSGGYGQRELVIRINGLDTAWGRNDMAAAAAVGPDAVLVPKISTPGDILKAAEELRAAGAPDRTRLWAMMETPHAILGADAIARTAADSASRLAVLVMGTNDLAKESRARLVKGRVPMLAWLSTCVLAAHAHGAEILDGVYGDIGDKAGFHAECEQGRDLGMDGKTLIHPGQVAICNEVFAPAPAEVEWARKIIAAFALPENSDKGAISLDGRMVERLHAEIARHIVKIAEAIAAQSA